MQQLGMASRRVFATRAPPQGTDTGLGDIVEWTKIGYTVEFDQGLTQEQKKKMKRFDIYRADPSNS
jgi:hypothetical protein